jgi:hypothetical protein
LVDPGSEPEGPVFHKITPLVSGNRGNVSPVHLHGKYDVKK